MVFELYKPIKGGRFYEEIVSLSPYGRIGISRQCYNRYFNSSLFVELYYDNETKRIGIKPLKETSASSIALGRVKTKSAISIHGKGFMEVNGIHLKQRKRYHPIWDDKEKLLLIQLD